MPADVAAHEALGITAVMLERMQICRVTDHEAREKLALQGRSGRLDGILYPYFDPQQHRIVTYRLRRDHPEFEHGKPKNKYLSAWGNHRHLYFGCDDAQALADATIPALLMESEKSTLAVRCGAERLGRPVLPIGLGGCWGWRGRIGIVETPNGGHSDEVGPLPDLARITWTNREAVLIFDANASSNENVQAARRALGLELARRGAQLRVLDLLPEEGMNGPDDYIGRHGAEQFFAVLDRAPDAASFDAIFRLNSKHAVVPEGGKTIVITDEHDPVLDRYVLTRSTFADFRNRYLNEYVDTGRTTRAGEPIRVALGHFWLRHPDRREYAGIVMSPNRDVPKYWNLWRGFTVTPQPGTWTRLRHHIQHVICAGDQTVFAYVSAWLAYCVQHPDRQAEVALALRGLRGTGKGILARALGSLFGQHYLQTANPKHLVGNFNAHLQDCIVLFADEAFWAGDKAGESVLKMLITEPVIPIERKGRDVVLAPNLLHVILASNHDWIVPAGMDERRFCVLDVADTHRQDHVYFAGILEELETGGRAGFLHDLLKFDLSGVNLRAVPATEALRQQKVLSLLPHHRWLFDKLTEGRWLPAHEGWVREVWKDAIHDDYLLRLQKLGVERRSTETELGMLLNKMFPTLRTVRRLDAHDVRRQMWVFPDLEVCRADFNAATQTAHPWDEDDQGEECPT